MTSERKGSLRRHQLLSVLMVIEERSAQSDHLPKKCSDPCGEGVLTCCGGSLKGL